MSCFLHEQFRSAALFRTLAGLAAAALVWGGVLGGFSLPAWGTPPSEDPDRAMAADAFFHAAVNERQELLAAIATAGLSESRRVQLSNWLAQGGSRQRTVEDREDHLAAIFDLGRTARGRGVDTGWIDNAAVVRVLVTALASEATSVRQRAAFYLLNYARPAHLADQAGRIKEALASRRVVDGPALLARLPLDAAERAAWLNKPDLPPKVRARLGDRAAEDRLIEQFTAATAYHEASRAAADLGYVGTRRAGAALAAGLSSDLFQSAVYERLSLRCDVIRALGRIHPDESMLNEEANLIMARGETDYGLDRTREYVRRVLDWAREQYGVAIEFPKTGPAGPPLLCEKFVVKRPLGKRP